MIKKTIIAAAMLLTSSVAYSDVTLTMGSGGEGGFYEATMNAIADTTFKKYRGKEKLQILVENTGGTQANIEGLSDGLYGAVIAQADGFVGTKGLPSNLSISNAHEEAVYYLINKEWYDKEDKGDLEDIEGSTDELLAVVAESGSLVTLKSFVREDGGYEPNLKNAVYFDDAYDAAEAVANGRATVNGEQVKVVGMIAVSRKGALSGQIIEDFGDQLVIGEATDGDFNDAKDMNGESLYYNCSIEKDQRQGLKAATFGDQDTICMRAQVAVNNDWVAEFEDKNDAKKAKKALKRGINGILKRTR